METTRPASDEGCCYMMGHMPFNILLVHYLLPRFLRQWPTLMHDVPGAKSGLGHYHDKHVTCVFAKIKLCIKP